MIKNKVELGLKQQIYLMIIVSVIFCVVSVTHASDTSNLDEKIKKQELEYQKIQKQMIYLHL